MLVSEGKAKAREAAAYKKGIDDFISSFRDWHEKSAIQDSELEEKFCVSSISEFTVNVWDDYPEDQGTFAYVEMSDVPDAVCFEVLLHLLQYARSNSAINATGAQLGLRFYDSSVRFPLLIGRRDGEYSLYKRWELTIARTGYEALEFIASQLKEVPPIFGKPLKIISES